MLQGDGFSRLDLNLSKVVRMEECFLRMFLMGEGLGGLVTITMGLV